MQISKNKKLVFLDQFDKFIFEFPEEFRRIATGLEIIQQTYFYSCSPFIDIGYMAANLRKWALS